MRQLSKIKVTETYLGIGNGGEVKIQSGSLCRTFLKPQFWGFFVAIIGF